MEVVTVKGYYVVASVDERSNRRIKGPFFSHDIASLECQTSGKPGEGLGWYGADDGYIEDVWFLQFPNGNILEYNPEDKYHFVDLERDAKKEMEESIKSKLSEKEIEFLNLK